MQLPFVPGGNAQSAHIATVVSQHLQLLQLQQQEEQDKAHHGSAPAYRETKQARSKRVAATKHAVISQQLQNGHCEVNIGPMSREDVELFVQKLHAAAPGINTLKLRSIPRGTTQLAYDLAEQNDPRVSHRPPPLLSAQHKHGVCISSAHVQHQNVRFKLYASISIMLSKAPLTYLELGMRLSLSGYTALSKGLARCETIKHLSFAGSHMGDAPLEAMQEGLCHNLSLEELDVTACNLTDVGMACLAAVVKHHAQRRANATFEAGLRQYPDPGLPPAVAHMAHYAEMRNITQQVDSQCGGWLHLELCENPQVTDRGVLELRDALAFDRRMVLLSLRGCGLSLLSEREFVTLMREHQALARVDLRQCTGRGAKRMGILKLNKGGAAALTVNCNLRTRTSQPGSPALTVKSLALHQLLEGETTRKHARPVRTLSMRSSVAASECGSRAGRLQRNLSTVSWGDKRLVSPFGMQGADTACGLQQDARPRVQHIQTHSDSAQQRRMQMPVPSPAGDPDGLSSAQGSGCSSPTLSCASPTHARGACKLSWFEGDPPLTHAMSSSGVGGCRVASILKTGAAGGFNTDQAGTSQLLDLLEQANASDTHYHDKATVPRSSMQDAAVQVTLSPAKCKHAKTQRKKRGHMLISKSVTASPALSVAVNRLRASAASLAGQQWHKKAADLFKGPATDMANAVSPTVADLPTASTSETIAELTGLLQNLELEVSKAEYQAQLTREAREQDVAEQHALVSCNITANKASVQLPLSTTLQLSASSADVRQSASASLQSRHGEPAAETEADIRLDSAGGLQAQLTRWCSVLDAALQLP